MDLIGTRIGSYVVERQLGAGGAGTVYACRHTLIDREVAVKFLHDEHVRDPDQVARFFQEAKAAAEIGHPNIIVIIDYGTLELAGVARTYVMSPEQCEGKGAIDHRSDIYSLGVMLYEMLTGTLPFEGSVSDILFAHMTRSPDPPRQRNPSIPPAWEALCLRMMEKAREARFQSVTQLAHALEDLRGHAMAYEAARVERVETGHSGHTLVSGASNDIRATLRVDVGELAPAGADPAPPPPVASEPIPGAPKLSYASFDPRSGCAALVEDPRHAAFARTLMSRPVGRWFEVSELCQTASVAQPATLPRELGLFVAWLEHPYPDPSLGAVVFLSLRTGWSTVVLCARAR